MITQARLARTRTRRVPIRSDANRSRRADPPQPRLKGPHFAIPPVDWEAYEGWSHLQAWMGTRQDDAQAAVPATELEPKATCSSPTESPPGSADDSAAQGTSRFQVPKPHANWNRVEQRADSANAQLNLEENTQQIAQNVEIRRDIRWPAVTDRLLANASDSLRDVADALLQNGGAMPLRVLVTGRQANEGATSSALALARWLSQTGLRVLLVDGDSVTAGLSRALQMLGTLRNDQSLASQLAAISRLRAVRVDCPQGVRLDIVPNVCRPIAVGTSARADESLTQAIQRWSSGFDIVLIDGGPMISAGGHWPDRLRRFSATCEAALVVRRPDRLKQSTSQAIEPVLLSWGIERIVIANIIRDGV